ncbi:MAG: hypothetical protein PHQ95_00815 [Candidatus Gracilibacteria bacterium]|nr:hypothetical protein [Candidatus Gracilibacteria bacterium]
MARNGFGIYIVGVGDGKRVNLSSVVSQKTLVDDFYEERYGFGEFFLNGNPVPK